MEMMGANRYLLGLWGVEGKGRLSVKKKGRPFSSVFFFLSFFIYYYLEINSLFDGVQVLKLIRVIQTLESKRKGSIVTTNPPNRGFQAQKAVFLNGGSNFCFGKGGNEKGKRGRRRRKKERRKKEEQKRRKKESK